jgi:putative zinc finger/helix-turn-helix YgiT family protein
MEHDGRAYSVAVNNLAVLRCERCGAQVLPDESYARLTDSLRVQDGLLLPAQIAEKRRALGLSQKDFAELLGVAAETVSRWESGGQIQQRVMNDFMQAFFDLPALREYLMRKRGMAPATPQTVPTSLPAQGPRITARLSPSEYHPHSYTSNVAVPMGDRTLAG